MNFFNIFIPRSKTSEKNQIDFYELLKPMQKNCIRISYDETFEGECPVGKSKIGGKPDLPPGFQWYYYRGKSYKEIIALLPPAAREYVPHYDPLYNAVLPLSFLAQINCAEVREYDNDNLLPSKGILYFFYEIATTTWGFLGDKDSAKVYYYPGSVSELRRTDFPFDLEEAFKLPEMPMTFSSKIEFPDYEEFLELCNNIPLEEIGMYTKYFDRYNHAITKIGIETGYNREEGARINKLLGYADLIQDGMLLKCEAAAIGVELYSNCGGYSKRIPKKALRQYRENCKKWRLLLQLESIEAKSYEMLWGDVGRIYYYINTEDLCRMDFDNCWLILQCS